MRLIIALLALLICVPATPGFATAPVFPERARRAVVDEAGVIAEAEEAALNHRLVEWERSTGHQLVVATVPSLHGQSIADYGNGLLRAWGIGRSGANDGIILLLAPNEREVRIEVGYGFEPILTDAVSARIIRETITPALQRGETALALSSGAERIMQTAAMDPAEARALALAAERGARDDGFSVLDFVKIVAAILVGGFFFLMILWWPWYQFWPIVALFPGPAGRAQRKADEERAERERQARVWREKEEAKLRRRWERLQAKGSTQFKSFAAFKADHERKERIRLYGPSGIPPWQKGTDSSSSSATWASSSESGWDGGSSSSGSGFDGGGGSGGGGGADSRY